MFNIRQLLINFYLEHSSLLGTYTESCRESASKGSVHKLRIALKNLKGLVVLLHYLDPEHQGRPELPANLKKLFSISGELRDIQVLEASLILEEQELDTKFTGIRRIFIEEKKEILERLAEVLNELHYWMETAAIEEYLYKVLGNYEDEHEISARSLKYIQRSWGKIRSLIAKEHTEDNLHKIRIRNRNLNAVLSVVQTSHCMPGLFPFHPQDLIQFQRLLGKWHDVAVFRNKVKNYAGKTEEKNRHQIRVAFLENSLAQKQRRMKRKIARFMKRFMNS